MTDVIHVVTGATSGIGNAIARALCNRSKPVVAIGRNDAALQSLASEYPGLVQTRRLDLLDDQAIRALATELESTQSSVAALVHSAGEHVIGELAGSSIEDMDRMYRTNVRAPHLLTQALLPCLERGRGNLIFINSSAGHSARAGAGAYAATKHALRGLADAWRLELNARGIRVLSLYPGRTFTPRIERLFAAEGRTLLPELLLQPADIASIVMLALELPATVEITELSVRPAIKSY